jgi:hypothetical protein
MDNQWSPPPPPKRSDATTPRRVRKAEVTLGKLKVLEWGVPQREVAAPSGASSGPLVDRATGDAVTENNEGTSGGADSNSWLGGADPSLFGGRYVYNGIDDVGTGYDRNGVLDAVSVVAERNSETGSNAQSSLTGIISLMQGNQNVPSWQVGNRMFHQEIKVTTPNGSRSFSYAWARTSFSWSDWKKYRSPYIGQVYETGNSGLYTVKQFYVTADQAQEALQALQDSLWREGAYALANASCRTWSQNSYDIFNKIYNGTP